MPWMSLTRVWKKRWRSCMTKELSGPMQCWIRLSFLQLVCEAGERSATERTVRATGRRALKGKEVARQIGVKVRADWRRHMCIYTVHWSGGSMEMLDNRLMAKPDWQMRSFLGWRERVGREQQTWLHVSNRQSVASFEHYQTHATNMPLCARRGSSRTQSLSYTHRPTRGGHQSGSSYTAANDFQDYKMQPRLPAPRLRLILFLDIAQSSPRFSRSLYVVRKSERSHPLSQRYPAIWLNTNDT